MRPAAVTCTNFHTSAVRQDIDQAAKYIGAGAATVGVAGSGKIDDIPVSILHHKLRCLGKVSVVLSISLISFPMKQLCQEPCVQSPQ